MFLPVGNITPHIPDGSLVVDLSVAGVTSHSPDSTMVRYCLVVQVVWPGCTSVSLQQTNLLC